MQPVHSVTHVSGLDRKDWSGREDLNFRPPAPRVLAEGRLGAWAAAYSKDDIVRHAG
jgi:hypothetical protein